MREHLVLERGQIGLPGYRLKRALDPRLDEHGTLKNTERQAALRPPLADVQWSEPDQ